MGARRIRSRGWLLAAMMFVSAVQAQPRGMLRVVDADGDDVVLYKGSYALLIGVSSYEDAAWEPLRAIPGELQEVGEALQAHGFDVTSVIDPDADMLETSIKDFINDYGYHPDNRLLIFFAGHGHTWVEGNQGYLLPVDAPQPASDSGHPGVESDNLNWPHFWGD